MYIKSLIIIAFLIKLTITIEDMNKVSFKLTFIGTLQVFMKSELHATGAYFN